MHSVAHYNRKAFPVQLETGSGRHPESGSLYASYADGLTAGAVTDYTAGVVFWLVTIAEMTLSLAESS
jgi:hypothetical protein